MKVSPKAILLVLNLFGDVAKQAASNDSNEFSGETNKEALNLDVESSKDRQSGVLESDRSLLDECSDVPGWQDADGFTCSWYGSFGGVECTISGDSHAGSGGLTANEACCVCKSQVAPVPQPTPMPVPTPTWTWPTWTCNDVPGFRDSDGYDCHWYGLNGGVECILSGDSFPNPITGLTANQACCVCHRGNPPITPAPVPTPTPPPVTFSPALPCTDVPGFRDSDGYDCAWYAMYDALPCKLDGDSYPDPNTGLTANQACCVCKGQDIPPPTRPPSLLRPTLAPAPEPSPSFRPPPAPTAPENTCSDVFGWLDAYDYPCSWYTLDYCRENGHLFAGTFGLTPNEACCVCKAYAPSSIVPAPPSPTPPPQPSPTPPCKDVVGWLDAYGYPCAWYAYGGDQCRETGDMFAGYYGLTPNEACCVCKGYDPPGNFPPPPSRNRFYEFHIDCYMPDESFLQTTATIEIFFWSADHTFLGRDTLQGLRCSSIYADEKVGIFSTTPVEYVEVATRSSDAFLIDEAWLTVDSSYELYHWDEDGSLGYCLSTERDDYITHGWADNLRYPTDGCQPAYFFTRNGVRPLLTVGTS